MESVKLSVKKVERLEKKRMKFQAYDNLSSSHNKNQMSHITQDDSPEIKKMKFTDEKIAASEPKNIWLPADSQELVELRKRLRERKEQRANQPHLRLNDVGQAAEFKPGADNVPLFFPDIQDLFVFTLIGNTFHSPRWCKIDKISRVSHVALVVVDNVSKYTYSSGESQLPSVAASNAIVETLLPSAYGSHLVEELANVPISPAYRRRLLEEHGSVDGVLQKYKHLRYKVLRAMFPIKSEVTDQRNGRVGMEDRYPRTELLLAVDQLIEENYPLPHGALKDKYKDYIFTKEWYTEVSEYSPLFAVDCEMCVTAAGMELTRVSIVDESMTLVYDSLVKPDLPITDYLTRFSGVTPQQMKDVTTKLCDVQNAIRQLLPSDAILVGQSLNCDLDALKMMHPYIIDTSVIFNISGNRRRKSKLQTLAREFLGEKIQDGRGHCSVEDSSSCLKLVKLKLNHTAEFGDAVQVGRDEAAVHQASAVAEAAGATAATTVTCPQITQSLVQCAVEAGRSVAIVGAARAVSGYVTNFPGNELVTYSEEEKSAEAITRGVKSMESSSALLLHLPEPADLSELDGWVSKLHCALPPRALLILVLAGPTTGLCCLKINKS